MNFYVISNNIFIDKEFSVCEPVGAKYGDFPRCISCNKAIGPREWLPPRVVQRTKKPLGDFVFGSVSPFLVSDRVKIACEKHSISGFFIFEPVSISNETGLELLSPKISSGKLLIDESLSGVERDEKPVCKECRTGGIVKSFELLCPIVETWDGLEVFTLKQFPGIVCVSQDFVNFVQRERFLNLEVCPFQNFSSPWRNL